MPEAAADAFERKELAALRPMTSNRDMRRVVKELGATTGTSVCGSFASPAASAEYGISGQGQFIDHCHPNADGHRVLGQALAVCITDMGIGGLRGRATLSTDAQPFRWTVTAATERFSGFKTNPVTMDTTTAEGAALAGHQAFVMERYPAAIAHYELALSQGGDPAVCIMQSAWLPCTPTTRLEFQRELSLAARGWETSKQRPP